jgi:hypothetical protein
MALRGIFDTYTNKQWGTENYTMRGYIMYISPSKMISQFKED